MRVVHEPTRSRRLSRAAGAWLLVGAALALPACGGDSERAALVWASQQKLVTPPELPSDRVLIGRVRNDSDHELRLDATRARVVDADGRELRSAVRFAAGFGHGLYSPRRRPSENDPEFERRRLGELAVIPAGKDAPLTVSWRLVGGAGNAARLELGALTLDLGAAPR